MDKEQCVIFKDLPKYLMIDTGKDCHYYHPIIFKWEWDDWQNAYYAMYARYYPRSGNFNPKQALFHVTAPSYDKAVEKFMAKCQEMQPYMKGKTWKGGRPEKIVFEIV